MSRSEVVKLWYHVAAIRASNGDKEGAKRARQNSRILQRYI